MKIRNVFGIIVTLLISLNFAMKIRLSSQTTLLQERNNTLNESMNNRTTVPLTSEPNAATTESFKELSLLIPITFWTDQNGNFSREFIALRTLDNNYLSCSSDNILSANSTELSKYSLWRPIKIRQTLIALRSFNGKYLGFRDQKFTCDFDRLSADNYFDALRNPLDQGTLTVPILIGDSNRPSNLNTTISPEAMEAGGTAGMSGRMTNQDTLAFKINQGFMGVQGNDIVLSKDLNRNSIFKAPKRLENIQ